MEVGGLQGIEERQVPTEPRVEPLDLGRRSAAHGADVFHPSVSAAIEEVERAEGGGRPALVEPGQELLKVKVRRQRLRLVDEPETRGKGGQEDPASTPMRISGPLEPGERAGIRTRARGRGRLPPSPRRGGARTRCLPRSIARGRSPPGARGADTPRGAPGRRRDSQVLRVASEAVLRCRSLEPAL